MNMQKKNLEPMMNMKTSEELIRRFHCVVVDSNEPIYSLKEVNKWAVPHGYYVTSGACTAAVLEFVQEHGLSVDHTFYKSFNDVLERDRFELFLDQLAHYASTYGTGFTEAPYVVNDGDTEETKYQRLTVIYSVTDEEMYTRCLNLIKSGIALSCDTLEAVCNYVIDYNKRNKVDMIECINSVTNKEAKCMLYKNTGIHPEDPVELLRLLQYVATGETLLIKDRNTMRRRKQLCPMLLTLTEYEIRQLGAIFNRFKPVFLQFKGTESQSLIINKISRYSKLYHKPFDAPFWSDVTSYVHDMREVRKRIDDITAFKAVAILQSLREASLENETKLQVVRNGKIYIRQEKRESNQELAMYHMELMQVLFNKIVDTVRKNTASIEKKTYRMPKNVSLGVPASERTFIGNYPFGTTIHCDKNTYAGICWKDDSGWSDLDLHFYDMNGSHYGWCNDYCDINATTGKPNVVFSGDMTSPVNGSATEVMYFKSDVPDGVFISSNYGYPANRGRTVKSSVFVATNGEELDKMSKGYMVDKKDIVFSGDITTNNRDSIIGFFEGGTFTVANLQFSFGGRGSSINPYIDAMRSKAHSFVSLEAVLDAAGFTVEEDDEAVAGLDFSNVEKGDVIKLLA